MDCMKILLEAGSAEIVEKKSRFIATLCSVSTPEEAQAFIEQTKKKYWDAKHNCSAYVIGKDAQYTRCNDDGEPAQTAGLPMLEVLLHSEVRNVAVVVTRYFGGTLLGTGGLIRAYGQTVKEALANSRIGEEVEGFLLTIEADYSDVGKIQYLLAQKKITVVNSAYAQTVLFELQMQKDMLQGIIDELVETTCGRVMIKEKQECTFLAETLPND
ncbi:MAG: YigZ family protein [Lachnospiraceae bacterium]|nr:YigZ family protein [Lachnospiraceae bacterium]